MASDVLAMQGRQVPACNVLIHLSWNIPVSAHEGLKVWKFIKARAFHTRLPAWQPTFNEYLIMLLLAAIAIVISM